MRRVVLVCVGALLVAGVAGAQHNEQWCPEGMEPCVRILDPIDGATVGTETAFLIEVVLTPDLVYEGAHCEFEIGLISGLTPDSYIVFSLVQHQRPRGGSPVFYNVITDVYVSTPEVMELSKPTANVGDYLPHRFRVLGELHLEPGDSLRLQIQTHFNGCGRFIATDWVDFSTNPPPP